MNARDVNVCMLALGIVVGMVALLSIEFVLFSGKPTEDPIQTAKEHCAPGTLKSYVPYSGEFSCYEAVKPK